MLLTRVQLAILGAFAAILLVITVVQTVRLNGFLWFDGALDKLEDCARDRNELRAISTKKNEQREKTGQNIGQAEKGEREAKPIADKIREAPIPPNCATPGLDILRNEL
jgi:hypothetical protein